jgi:membrane protein involved in colicin uptake
MAENMKTYTANVDVDTKDATKNIDNLNKATEETAEGFTKLQLRIRETQKALQQAAEQGDKTSFNKLKGDLEGLEDQLEAVNLGAAKFDDSLAALPGPAGLVGNAMKSVDGAFKLLAANPIVAIIGVLAGLFMLLKESMSKTAEGQEVLNKISEAFGKIIGPIMVIVQKVAIPVFEGFAFVLGKVAEGFGKFAKFLGIAQKDIDEASRNSSESLKKKYEEQEKLEDEAQKKAEEKRKKAEEDRKKKAEERARKEKEEAEKRAAIALEAEKIQLEATLSQLSDRDRELKEREIRFQEELKKLKLAGVTDLTNFENEYRIDQLAINQKFDDEELKRQQEQNLKTLEEQKKIDAEKKKQQEELDKFIIDSEKFKADAIAFIQDTQVANVAKVGNILTGIAGKNKKLAIAGLVIEQGANIAKVVIDTARAITAATAAAAPFIANPITAIPATANLARVIAQSKISAGLSIAGIVAGAAKGIAAINSAQIPGASGGGGAGAGGGGGGVSIPTPPVPSTTAPRIQGGSPTDPTSLIRQTISGAMSRPIRAFVVSQDVSSTQALDRRTNNAATFG